MRKTRKTSAPESGALSLIRRSRRLQKKLAKPGRTRTVVGRSLIVPTALMLAFGLGSAVPAMAAEGEAAPKQDANGVFVTVDGTEVSAPPAKPADEAGAPDTTPPAPAEEGEVPPVKPEEASALVTVQNADGTVSFAWYGGDTAVQEGVTDAVDSAKDSEVA